MFNTDLFWLCWQLPLRDTILHLASRRRDAELVKIFVELGSPVDKTNGEGQTALHIGAINGDLNLLKILLMARADASICDSMVNTYLTYLTITTYMYNVCSKITTSKYLSNLSNISFSRRTGHQFIWLQNEVIQWQWSFWLTNLRYERF